LKTLTNGSVSEAFDYDNNGNLVETKLNNSIVAKYEYDIRNQLTKASDGNNNTLASFDYDFERKRTSKVSANVTTNYTYAGNQVVNETNNNVISASYTIGGGEIVKSEFVANGESNYHFTDALGSVTSLTNNLGSLTSRSDYDAFGLQTGGSGSSNSIGYTGQRLDNETGLMALGNGERYYSPSYARFIQQDSFSGNGSMPQSLNRFAYAYNNPNSYRDLNGNNPEGEKDQVVEGFREARKYLSNNSSGNWYVDAYATFQLGMAEVGYGILKFAKNTVKELAYTAGDIVTEYVYDRLGTDDKNRVYSSSMYQSEQAKINGGMSRIQAKIESAGAFAYGAIGGNLVEKVGGNILALYDGRMDIDDYNVSQGEALGEALTLYAGARSLGKGLSKITIESVKTGGTKAVSVLREGIKSGRNALESIKESVGKVADKWAEHSNKAVERAIQNGRQGELGAVGEIHPRTANSILAEADFLEYQGSNIDSLVEGAKPSTQGRLVPKHQYENPGHHDPTGGANPYNPNKSVLPENHVELFESSKPFGRNMNGDWVPSSEFPKGTEITRFAKDSQGNTHRFNNRGNDPFHWTGSTNGVTLKNRPNTLKQREYPSKF
jgi:RHS repeat-associated protein